MAGIRGPSELALTNDQTAELLSVQYGLIDPDLADQIQEATSGWATLVRLSAETVASDGMAALTAPGGKLAMYLSTVALEGVPTDMLRLLRDLAGFAPVTAGLCEAVGSSDGDMAMRLFSDTGFVCGGKVVPVIADLLRQNLRQPTPRHTAALAAAWYDENGPTIAAVHAYADAGNLDRCAEILRTGGDALVNGGYAASIADLLTQLLQRQSDRRLQLLLGDALRISGSALAAARAYAVVADAEPRWNAELAWRMGLVHYHRGDGKAALEAFSQAVDESAALLSARASAHLQLGETAIATDLARKAVRCAETAKDDDALAAAQVSLALCLGMAGDNVRSEELLAEALTIAGRVGNLVLRARVLTTQTYHLLVEARYTDALRTARETAECAVKAGSANMRAFALGNEADALMMLGRYDEAIRQYERVLGLCRRMGSRRSAGAQLGLGEVYRRRGWTEQARAAYESAVGLAEESGDNHVLVGALAGLARVIEDPKAAKEAADQAAERASTRVTVTALLAQGWVALQSAGVNAAAEIASEAARVAREERDRAGLAESLELRAAAETDVRRARAALLEAHAIWSGVNAKVDAARIKRKLGRLPEAATDERLDALLAEETLIAAGVPIDAAGAGKALSIKVFGRFELYLGDQVVPATQWQSRKARDLLRILVTRRGHPVPRGELCELLWPDDDPTRTGHRLSVLLSIVKGVLDPHRTLAADHYLVADQASIALDITRLRIDVEEFLADVTHGRRMRDRGAMAQAYQLLSAADGAYRADVFADEPYADWSDALREQARAAHVSSLLMLAQVSRALGDLSGSVGYLLRLLTTDPYDETGHRTLVETLTAGGQHGEARRAHARYCEAMRAIGVRPTVQYHQPMRVP